MEADYTMLSFIIIVAISAVSIALLANHLTIKPIKRI